MKVVIFAIGAVFVTLGLARHGFTPVNSWLVIFGLTIISLS